ncbi:MAG: TerB family tellurite resistance protein [Candidatus Cyclobacteriaceae bacterium M3_2C_046]
MMNQEVENRISKFRLLHIKNLTLLANIDNHIDEEEYKFLCTLAQKYEMPAEAVDKIIQEIGDEKPEIPSEMDQRINQLLDLVRMMMADGKIDNRERYFCSNVADAYGFHPELIDFLLHIYNSDKADFDKWQALSLEAERFVK